jgi:3'-phosphoadenosine 5'-phosphosulfate sulfotransferase (PAPS reductase)/FAD synthetase
MLVKEINRLIDRKALFVINHSGGKDSQAMTLYLRELVPVDQLIIVHADLGVVEWEGSIEHIEYTSIGIELRVTKSVKTFFEMVLHRGMFPDASRRQCTSDLKRGPIEREIRAILKERGLKLIVNCMGMRAEESPNRSKLVTFKFNERNSKAGREWYDWLPIHDWTTEEVFDKIHSNGQKAFWIYYKGVTRKSCSFCIMGSKNDLTLAAKFRPQLYRQYVLLEKKLNHTLQMSRKGLEEITGIKI